MEQAEALASGAVIRHFGPTHLRQMTISVPPFATQQVTVAEIKAEQALVAANRELIARFEKKIQPTLARVWGEDLPVAEITQTANPSIDALSMPKIPNYYVAKV